MLAARCVGPARGQAPATALIGIGRLAYNVLRLAVRAGFKAQKLN